MTTGRFRSPLTALVAVTILAIGSPASAQSMASDPGLHVSWRDADEPHRAAAERELLEIHLALRQLLSRRARLERAEMTVASTERQLHELHEAFTAITERAPSLVTAWVDLGDIDFELRDGAAMLRHLQTAAVHAGDGPQRAGVLFQLGIAFTMLDRFVEARDAYRTLLDLPLANSTRGLALCNLAEIETYLHAPDDSIAHYQACVAIIPGYDGGLWGLASALDREGREYEARDAAQHALSIDPAAESLTSSSVFYTPAYEVHYYLGLAREAQGRNAEALQEWQRYLDAGGSRDTWARRAEAHVRALSRSRTRAASSSP